MSLLDDREADGGDLSGDGVFCLGEGVVNADLYSRLLIMLRLSSYKTTCTHITTQHQ